MSDQPNTTPGFNTKFAFADIPSGGGSPSSWTDIGQIVEISPPEIEADDVEVSNMDSPERFKQFEAGWADAGEVELTTQYEKDAATDIYAIFRQPKAFRITFEDESTWVFQGHVKKLGGEIDREGIITQVLTVKISGKPVFAAA